jgi:molecular chaperone HtpG
MHKDVLEDLLLFKSSTDRKYVTLKEYADGMKEEQTAIYYAAGESIEKIEMLPQLEAVKARGFEVLYLTDDVDEFALKMLGKYADKEFRNVSDEALDIASEEEKATLKEKNESAEDMLKFIKEEISEVNEVRFILNYNIFSVKVTLDGTTYEIPSYGYVRIEK